MTLENFERLIINKYRNDEDFVKFMLENPDFNLELEREQEANSEMIYQDDEVLRDMVVGYLEEINLTEGIKETEIQNLLERISEDEVKEKFVIDSLSEAAKIALYFLRDGIEYLELVQEGILGASKALKYYTYGAGNLKNYIMVWIGKEMSLYIEDKFEQTKTEFLYYMTKTDMEDIEITEEEKKIKMKLLENKNLEDVPFKLNDKEIKILEFYFGFGLEKRYSVLEIEKELELPKDSGEEMFFEALNKISNMGGRMFTL